ncbi:hypothetical protein HDV04_003242 [Boothiomyces sp. JEL0838]|nr:hypothetical protein HDV04_003242 [Boothiomyces sp. JEL0838]
MEVYKPLLFLLPEKDSQATRDTIAAIKELKSYHIITIDKITDQFKKYKSLSPNREGTELYPDGIISNEWITKHEKHLSNVCLLVSEMYEMKDKDPLGGINMEKDYDLLTIQQINEKRILANSVGSKFGVLFIIKQENQQTHDRLQNFRKTCHLDKTQVFTFKDQITFQKPLVELSNLYCKDREKKIKKKKMGASTSMNARLFGDVVEKLKLPLPYPVPGSTANAALSLLNSVATSGNNWMGNSGGTVFGPYSSVNTLFTVQQSGFYYLIAAKGLEDAWIRYNGAISMPDGVGQPEFIVEKMQEFQNYDFPGNIIELLSRAYETFKRLKYSRLTLYIASEIARIYSESHQYDLSIKFYDRISKTYRKELWFGLLGHILFQTYRCARNINDSKTMVECAVESLYPECGVELEIPEGEYQVDMEMITKFLQVDFQFYTGYGQVNNEQKYQIILKMLGKPIQIDEIRIQFNLSQFDTAIRPNGYNEALIGYCKNEAKIPQKGQTVVIEGSLLPTKHLHIEAQSILIVSKGLSLVYKLQDKKLRWYENGKFVNISGSRDVRVEQREPNIVLETQVHNGFTDQDITFTFKGKSTETIDSFLVLQTKCIIGDGNKQIDTSCAAESLIEVGVLSPGQEFHKDTVFKSSKAGIKHYVVTAYMYPGKPETVDFGDTKWLWKEFKEKPVVIENMFEVSFEHKQQCRLAIPERFGPGKTTKKIFEWLFTIQLVSNEKVELKSTEMISERNCVLLGGGSMRSMIKSDKETILYKVEAEVDAFQPATKLEIGQLKINWIKNGEYSSVIELPKPDIPTELLRVHAKIPGNLKISQPFLIEYTIQNLTLHVAELVTLFEPTDNFFYAGYKQKLVRILPLGTSKLIVNVIGMKSGLGRVPVLRIMKKSDFEKRDSDTIDLSKCFDVAGERDGLMVYINPNK